MKGPPNPTCPICNQTMNKWFSPNAEAETGVTVLACFPCNWTFGEAEVLPNGPTPALVRSTTFTERLCLAHGHVYLLGPAHFNLHRRPVS